VLCCAVQEAPADLRARLLRERFGSAQAAADEAKEYRARAAVDAFRQLLTDRGINGSSRCAVVGEGAMG